MAAQSSSILIPVQNSTEVIEVQTSELPDDPMELLQVLQAELAPLEVWLRFAVEYYRQGKPDHFLSMLNPLLDLHNETSAVARNLLFETFGDNERTKEQFLAILNALAAFHTVLGSRERDKAKRKASFDKAKKYYDSAETVDLLKGSTNVGRAVLELAKGELGRAEKTLTAVDAFNRNSVPALLGKACAKFHNGHARDALKLYREVFKVNPSPPATVRLGFAYCYHKLGQTELAQRALQRTLTLQEDCVEAMVGLAVIHLNEDNVEEAMKMLKRAYDLEPHNPSVLNHLASHFFYKAEYSKAMTLAKRALLVADSKLIKAESHYHIARCAHAEGNYKVARQSYLDAQKANPAYLAPEFGLGQMHLENNDLKRAKVCFEKVIKADPENVEALRVLGYLYGKEGRDTDALTLLTSATEKAPDDAAVWLELAKLQQRLPGQLAAANKAYEKAATVIKKVRTVPADIWNNIGAIRHRLGKLDHAEQAYGYALEVRTLKGVNEYDASCISTQYNLGRLYEDRGEIDRAIEKYKAILERFPNYPEAFLRLCACEEVAGRPTEAIGWATKALMLHPHSSDAYCTLGNLYLSVNDLTQAESIFLQVKKLKGCENDTYATNQLALIQLKRASSGASPSEPLSAACTTPAGTARVDRAVELFRKVLDQEPNNLYAANGLAVACVAKGRLAEAIQVFTQVREASTNCEHATTNLAQLNAALGEHATALSLYENATKRATGSSLSRLRLLMARSHFDAGDLFACQQGLRQLVRDEPEMQVAWHNLGLAYLAAAKHPEAKAYAQRVDAPPPRSVNACTQALRDLGYARCIFDTAEASSLVQAAGDDSPANAGDMGNATSGENQVGDSIDIVAAASHAVEVAAAVGIVGSSAIMTDAAASMGLSAERQESARKACERISIDLKDEFERAVAVEAKFKEEAALAEARSAELAAIREAKAAEEAAQHAAEEEAKLARIAEQKAKLAAKMETWREADAREAEAANNARNKRRRKEAEEEASDDGGAAGPAGIRGGLAPDEPEDAPSDDDDDDDDDLFGSDDMSPSESEPEAEDDEDDDDGADEEKAAKRAERAAQKEAKKARKEAREAKKARKAAKAAKKARKADKAAAKAAKAARKAELDARALAADAGDSDDAAADLFGSDEEGANSAQDEATGGRLIKRRKVVDDAEGDAAEAVGDRDDADDADADLFGDVEEPVLESTSAEPVDAINRKRKAVLLDDDDED